VGGETGGSLFSANLVWRYLGVRNPGFTVTWVFGTLVFYGTLASSVLGCSDSWVNCTLGSCQPLGSSDSLRMFAAGRMVVRLVLGSHGTLVGVSASLMMSLRDSDIPMNVPFTFCNKQPLPLSRHYTSMMQDRLIAGPLGGGRGVAPPTTHPYPHYKLE